ncbi:ATP-binding cassette domain-containing protein [Paraeggerthella hongkongensis]|uniref:ABC transporter ATP-binding protein n=1 Tax=Paraeggerthella hominis TaxID=2897351 RepID=UPI001C101E37|nr:MULTISPECIES: ATP-binding cassette domain-containing protein [Paraeggerthella]MBU5405007.1 ATP-binding cassette domain-containing protein [Paraeggerthella hongkongensis]MCD2432901.1 ATP-binding cassette domain-containing protein [Paraeggerthella hominis]
MEVVTDRPAVEARGFSFSYPDAAASIGPLDWRVSEGAFQLLVGATGSGKTTLLRCLKQAISPVGAKDGAFEAFGVPVEDMDAFAAASRVGYVAQSPENQIVCDAVWHELAFGLENLGVSQDQMRRRVAEVAHFFGIEPWFRRQVSELSGGQKQMLTLASVLAMQPRLLLLDEPTAQLDPVAEKNFLHALFRVNRELGITVVVATHAPESMASYATDAVELRDGRIEEVSLDRFAARPLRLPDAGRAVEAGRPARAADSAVALNDVRCRYGRDADWVLRGMDLNVRPGRVHALVGGNGSGKSTLLRLVAGVLKPERGSVINRLSSRQALLPQDPKSLFACDSVDEELREWQGSCGFSDGDVSAALERFGLTSCAASHPYDLSGGQQQKLALAKLLLTDPDLLLLDEPTKGLDAPSKAAVAEAVLDRVRAGATVLMATHDLTFAALVADEVTMLFDGEDACTEPAGSFFEGNLFYRPSEDAFARLYEGGSR